MIANKTISRDFFQIIKTTMTFVEQYCDIQVPSTIMERSRPMTGNTQSLHGTRISNRYCAMRFNEIYVRSRRI